MSRYQKGKTNLDFTEARDSQWQWHQLAHVQVCISLQTDNHASTPPLSFLQAGCPSCRPTDTIKSNEGKSTEGTGLLPILLLGEQGHNRCDGNGLCKELWLKNIRHLILLTMRQGKLLTYMKRSISLNCDQVLNSCRSFPSVMVSEQ